MKTLILDPTGWNYDTTTPYKTPLGGTQSAVAYLAAQLSDLGDEVTVINGTPSPTLVDGVRFISLPCEASLLNSFDVLVLVGTAFGRQIRLIGYTGPLILWCHHACDQGAVQALADPGEREVFQGYAMVSEWQANTYINKFGIAADKVQVLRNAASPSFHKTTPGKLWFERGEAPVLAYTSTPYRGLDVLLQAFPSIRAKIPGTRLRVFSGMGIYNDGLEDGFSCLYNLCQALPGVEYVGPLSQSLLAEEMAAIDVLSYPSTFAETSCISVMEAMASGCLIVTTALGALPETTAGFAHLLALHELDTHRSMFASYYATEMVNTLNARAADPQATLATLQGQTAVTRSFYTWRNRAIEWHDWLIKLMK